MLPSICKPQLQFNFLRKKAEEKAVPDGLEVSSPPAAVEADGCTTSLCSAAVPGEHESTVMLQDPELKIKLLFLPFLLSYLKA